jgi:hypothetical protein
MVRTPEGGHPTVSRIVVISIAIAALLVGACSPPPDEDPAGGDARFCQALGQYTRSLVTIRELPADATVAQYRSAADDVKLQLVALQAVSDEFAGAQLQELETAQQGLIAAVGEIPEDATAAEAEDTVDDSLDEVIEAAAGLGLAVCNTTPTPSA